MARKLTHKEKGFVQDIVKGETGVQAALNNYNTKDYSTAGAIASENLKKPKIVQALQEALPDEMLIEVHREGLYATKPIYSKEGQLVGEDADFSVRHKYLDSAYKLKGSYAAEKHINLNIDAESTERTRELGNRLIGLFRRGDKPGV